MIRQTLWGVLLLAGLALPARADLIAGSDLRSGNWSGGAYDVNGRFSHCVVQSSYQNGITLLFSIVANYTWRIGWTNGQWALNVGQTAPVTIWVDNVGPYELQATSINKTLIAADLPYNNQTFETIRRGNRMTVRMPGGTYYFDLVGTNAALEQVAGCVNRYRGWVSPTAPPQTTPPVQPSQPPPSPTTVSADQRAAAQRFMRSIAEKAEMMGTRILSPDEVKARNSNYLSASDMVWIDDAIVGAMRVLPPSSTPLQGLVDQFINADRSHCASGLQTGNAADERDAAVLRAYTTCQRDSGIVEVRYIVVPRPDGTRYLFTTVGTVPYGSTVNRVRAGDAALRQAVFYVLRQ